MTSETKNEDDDDMTTEERENWLRERGVQIENPNASSSSKTLNVTNILEQMSGLTISNSGDDYIPFVCIPHDESKPIVTLGLPSILTDIVPGDCLPDYIKPYFSDKKSIDATLLKDQVTKNFAGGNLSGLAGNNISAASMNEAASQGSVETFPLVHPADTNGYQGVYIYLDEVGLLKKLPNNKRASAIAASCGYYPRVNFYGDIFIGRVQSKPTLKNVPFEAGKDTNGSAEWMKRAVSENLAWQQELNKVTNRSSSERQPSTIGTDGKAAEEDNFKWTQDDEEIELVVPLKEVNKKLIKVSFLNRAIKVKYNNEEVVAVNLYSGIDVDGCTWTIDGSSLVITCEKADTNVAWPRIKA